MNRCWQQLCMAIFICCIPSWFRVPAPSSMPGTPCMCKSTHRCTCTPGLGTGSSPGADTCVFLTERLQCTSRQGSLGEWI